MSAVLEAPQQQGQTQHKLDTVIAKYIELRDQKAKIAADAKSATEKIDADLKIIEGWLHAKLHEMGAESFKADCGTAFLKQSDYCNVSDWNQTLPFIRENEAWHMLKKDVSKAAVQEYIKEHNVPPPGVNYGMKEEVQVRRGK